jgi:hypothetical protein
MKTQGLHDLVKKIFSDEGTKTQFMSDPASVLGQYSLTEHEKKAVLSTWRLSLATPDSTVLQEVVGPNTWWASPTP